MLNITDDSGACYSTWLEKWRDYMKEASTAIKVPLSASHLHTPLVPSRWTQALTQHPNQSLVNYFLNGISRGFQIGFKNPPRGLRSAHKNLNGALEHPNVVEEYLSLEILHHRISGPFKKKFQQSMLTALGLSPNIISLISGALLWTYPTHQIAQ